MLNKKFIYGITLIAFSVFALVSCKSSGGGAPPPPPPPVTPTPTSTSVTLPDGTWYVRVYAFGEHETGTRVYSAPSSNHMVVVTGGPRTVNLSWTANREVVVNRSAGGYKVLISTDSTFTGIDPATDYSMSADPVESIVDWTP